MALVEGQSGRKWINAFLAIGGVLSGYIVFSIIQVFGDRFELEAKVASYEVYAQGVALAAGLIFFFVISKNKKYYSFLESVFAELTKVVWPDRDSVTKLTIGIMIGVGICSGILVLVDLGIQKILSFLY